MKVKRGGKNPLKSIFRRPQGSPYQRPPQPKDRAAQEMVNSNNYHHEAALDVLTDGSELTEPAIFLTVRRYNKCSAHTGNRCRHHEDASAGETSPDQQDDDIHCYEQPNCDDATSTTGAEDATEDEGTVVARYNLTGLPSLTGRVSSDQAFNLLQNGAFRAVLVPSFVGAFHDGTHGKRGACVGGLSSLFLSLIQSGYRDDGPSPDVASTAAEELYGDVSILGPPGADETVRGILATTFGDYGRRRRPSLRICEVPAVPGSTWWEVYQDSYIKIWAQSVLQGGGCVDSTCGGGSSAAIGKEKNHNVGNESSSSSEPSSTDDASDSDDSSDQDSDEQERQESCTPNLEGSDFGGEARTASREYSVIYVAMLLSQNGSTKYSFAILPPMPSASRRQKCHEGVAGSQSSRPAHDPAASVWQALRHLPQEIVSSRRERGSSSLLNFILHLNPLTDNPHYGGKDATNAKSGHVSEEPSSKRRRLFRANSTKRHKQQVPRLLIDVPSWVVASNLTQQHLATSLDGSIVDTNEANFDDGILIRAQQRSKLLHDSLPFAFPAPRICRRDSSAASYQTQRENQRVSKKENSSSTMAFELRSCTSVILRGWETDIGASGEEGDVKCATEQAFTFVSRIESIISKRCKDEEFISWASIDRVPSSVVNLNYEKTVQSLQCAFCGGLCTCNECKSSDIQTNCGKDNNEIDVDNNEIDLNSFSSDCDSSLQNEENGSNVTLKDSIDMSSPHVLVLGTGCATPSPLRGSSAYGLLLPTSVNGSAALVLSAIIECGEGTLTSLLRHVPSLHGGSTCLGSETCLDMQLSYVNFVWISHAHLDHYGEAPVLIQAIGNAKQKFKHATKQSKPLLVIAPTKVLKYLDIVLKQNKKCVGDSFDQHGREQPTYIGVTHRELKYSPFARGLSSFITEFVLPLPVCRGIQRTQQQHHYGAAANQRSGYYRPFASLRNVEVEHCPEAFALILEMNFPSQNNISGGAQSTNALSKFILCFSGDTRPSARLVRACQSYSPQRLNLLIHEGTFLHDAPGQSDAIKKRHSTTAEALDIAKRIHVESCILTHFSQRYKHISVKDVCSTQESYPFSWGVALDGMMIPLTKRALSKLFRLSQCVDAVVTFKPDG